MLSRRMEIDLAAYLYPSTLFSAAPFFNVMYWFSFSLHLSFDARSSLPAAEVNNSCSFSTSLWASSRRELTSAVFFDKKSAGIRDILGLSSLSIFLTAAKSAAAALIKSRASLSGPPTRERSDVHDATRIVSETQIKIAADW